jgi:adenylate kinase family enzyme
LRIVILGNSGSGKSTLARELAAAASSKAVVLDLDTIVWEPGRVAVPRAPELAQADLDRFCDGHEGWIVEGCYGALAERALARGPELILLDPGEDACLAHCRARPWEPHKYASKEAQDAMLGRLLACVSEYYRRGDDMSLARHRAIFDAYPGPKRLIKTRA